MWGPSRSLLFLCSCLLFTSLVSYAAAYGPAAEQWASKSVLHILTDRFALPDCPSTPRPCKDLDNACGGTHVGLRQRLDYIQVESPSDHPVCCCVARWSRLLTRHRVRREWASMLYGLAQ
jgi:hypothetical protein